MILSQEIIEENEMNPPSTTFCMTSRSKSTILDGYKLSHGVVNEPNSKDQNILINLDKMVETLFREITYKLNRDFHVYINLWFYEDKFGWQNERQQCPPGWPPWLAPLGVENFFGRFLASITAQV